MQCEMCGTDKPLFLTEIEGTELKVCTACSKHGKVVPRSKPVKRPVKGSVVNNTPVISGSRHDRPRFQEGIVKEYPKLVRDARGKLGLKQEELAKIIAEKESVVHKIETGILEPSVRLAKKFQRALKIKLIEMTEAPDAIITRTESKGLTLGDMIKVKKQR